MSRINQDFCPLDKTMQALARMDQDNTYTAPQFDRVSADDPITLDMLHAAMVDAAEIVKQRGPEFIGLFERLEREYTALEARQSGMDKINRFLNAQSHEDSAHL